MYNISVVGMGFVGLSNAVLLSQSNNVTGYDISLERVNDINSKISPIKDNEIESYLKEKKLNLKATNNKEIAYKGADFIIISVPTNFDDVSGCFDTSIIESVIEDILYINRNVLIVIKSTIPVGYTERVRKKFNVDNIIFSPEFLREGKALYDNLYPYRIILGGKCERTKIFSNLLVDGAIKKDVSILFTSPTEAESIKLFSNTYLALRVSFFNELDTFSEVRGLNSYEIIKGVSLDNRIGDYYNNPSFGYGGYCLPKDVKQMCSNYEGVPNEIVKAISISNERRKNHIVEMILGKNPKTVGVYRLNMKSGSDNFRESSVRYVMEKLVNSGVIIIVYEPSLDCDTFDGYDVVGDLGEFKARSNIIICNRFDEDLGDVREKIYSRDLFNRD